MRYNIYLDETLINTIIADEKFCRHYCAQNSYTYKPVENSLINTSNAEEPISEIDQLRADIDYVAIMTGVEL